jgi:hypothetical protein
MEGAIIESIPHYCLRATIGLLVAYVEQSYAIAAVSEQKIWSIRMTGRVRHSVGDGVKDGLDWACLQTGLHSHTGVGHTANRRSSGPTSCRSGCTPRICTKPLPCQAKMVSGELNGCHREAAMPGFNKTYITCHFCTIFRAVSGPAVSGAAEVQSIGGSPSEVKNLERRVPFGATIAPDILDCRQVASTPLIYPVRIEGKNWYLISTSTTAAVFMTVPSKAGGLCRLAGSAWLQKITDHANCLGITNYPVLASSTEFSLSP